MEVAEHRPRWQLHEMASLPVVKVDHTFPQKDNLAHFFTVGRNLLVREVPPAAHVDDELVDESLLALIKEMAKGIDELAEQLLHQLSLKPLWNHIVKRKLFDYQVEIFLHCVLENHKGFGHH